MNSEKPIVFLDIDGVLNSVDFAINRKEKTGHRHIDQIDERAVGFLNEIADWNFVLSSSWRKFVPLEKMNEILKKQRIQRPNLGQNTSSGSSKSSRE